MLESRFVGALFVAPDAIRQGIGRALLDEVKQHYAWLSLEVYQKNESAVSFYHAQGFRIEDCAWQDDTQHPTWIMRWPADQMLWRQRRAGIFLQPRQGGVPGTAVAQPGCRDIFG